MSDEFDNKLPQEFSLSEIGLFSRRYCEPTEPIYKKIPELAEDPFKANEAVDWHSTSLERVTDPVDGILVTKAKLDVAEKELRLNPKQKEHFSGVKENIEGAIGFLDTIRSKAESKALRAIASGATIIGMTLGAAGCGNALAGPVEVSPTTPPIVETANIPTAVESVLPSPEASPTPEQTEIHSSFEINGEVEGLPVRVTLSIAKDTYEREVRPLDRWEYNPLFVEKYGEEEARNLMAGIIMKAHFFAWQEDDWEGRKGVSLSDYVQRIKNGEDMSYEIYATDRGSIVQGEKKMVDPSKPVEIIFSEKKGGDLWGGPIDSLSAFLYAEGGSLAMEMYLNPEYAAFEEVPRDDIFITIKTWETVSLVPMMALSFDNQYQISGNIRDEVIADYQIKMMSERPELEQLNLDFYKFDDYYSNNITMVPLIVRER